MGWVFLPGFLLSFFVSTRVPEPCSPNPSCVPNLKLLVSVVAEISRGVLNFLDAPLARTPANFGTKHCFLLSYSPNPRR